MVMPGKYTGIAILIHVPGVIYSRDTRPAINVVRQAKRAGIEARRSGMVVWCYALHDSWGWTELEIMAWAEAKGLRGHRHEVTTPDGVRPAYRE